jgi:hypothetical protein
MNYTMKQKIHTMTSSKVSSQRLFIHFRMFQLSGNRVSCNVYDNPIYYSLVLHRIEMCDECLRMDGECEKMVQSSSTATY